MPEIGLLSTAFVMKFPHLLVPALFLPALVSWAAEPTVTRWSFDQAPAGAVLHGDVKVDPAGPRPPTFPTFKADNRAAAFDGKNSSIRIKDPGANSPLDFGLNDSITIEAWVQCKTLKDGQQMYIVGKGRTQNPGVAANNQNWALRLRGQGGAACVSFVFRDERNRGNSGDQDWHRWTTKAGFVPGNEWHHVAVTYTFGKSANVKAFIDGQPLDGTWDMGGASELGPVVDDDEVWIGSSMGGSPGSTFNGLIDEVAIHRTAITAKEIATIFKREGKAPGLRLANGEPKDKAPEGDPVPPPVIKAEELKKGVVRVEIFEHADQVEALTSDIESGTDSAPKAQGVIASWSTIPQLKTEQYEESSFAFTGLPLKYNTHGARVDRSAPSLMRASAVVTLPEGEHRVLLRSLSGARLSVDGQQLAITSLLKNKYGDNEPVPDQAKQQLVPGLPLLPPGHREMLATFKSDGKPHVFTIESLVGGKNIRPEVGNLVVAIESAKGWSFLTPTTAPVAFNDTELKKYSNDQFDRLTLLNAQRRHSTSEEQYWQTRHDLARQQAKPAPEVPKIETAGADIRNPIDAFIQVKLDKAKVTPSASIDDAAFLRRATLDVIGLIPTPEETLAFLADKSPDKRAKAVDRLLKDPRWADRWVPYWQDVLAENPNLLKGTLNNTGPFRYWLYEALYDNRPMDRFVTELISMEGSSQYGGAAGFAIASQNDLPMAAKAQIVSSAFLAMEMKCARCHDAPSHPFNQSDLFSLAAMLQRKPVTVPGSSLSQGLAKNSHVTLTLKAGDVIDAHWPLASLYTDVPSKVLPGVLRRENDSREQLAAILTDPRNDRFAQVVVNRLWKEMMGFGIIDPVDDWENAAPSHKDLLKWLGHELIVNNYDLKHVAKLIMNSATYQRTPTAEASKVVKSSERLFEAPARRRMTAEQIVDSFFAAASQEIDSEPLTQDPECRQSAKDHSNFGVPRRAWEFAALSNERDRPALAKPRAQVFTDVLATFGWRESRTEPKSVRDTDANVLQPALLANGAFGTRISRLTETSAFTALALKDQPVEEFVRSLFVRLLSREPSASESQRVVELLKPGYENRRTGAAPAAPRPPVTKAVSWANHLHADATTVILDVEKQVKAGEAVTTRLTADWRERAEDAVWALMLSPETIYLP